MTSFSTVSMSKFPWNAKLVQYIKNPAEMTMMPNLSSVVMRCLFAVLTGAVDAVEHEDDAERVINVT